LIGVQNFARQVDTCPQAMQPRYLFYVVGSVVLLAAACFSVLPAWAAKWLACQNEGTPACERQQLADTQFVVACVGVAPAILLVWDTVRRSRRAFVWLGIGIAIYVTWALLLDAAVHGWDDLKLLP
jgi:hypothetical protein